MPPPQHSHEHSVPLPQPPQAPTPARNASRLLPVLGVVMGLLGLLLGAAAWLRAGQSDAAAPPVYSEQEVAEAKQAVCVAYVKGIRSIRVVASKRAENPADSLPVAVNSRVGEVAVYTYFLDALEANPAVRPELRALMRNLAKGYQDLVLIQLADGTPADWISIKDSIENSARELDQLCQ